ncbi:MAG: bile acid:sodium symporter family protein [Bacteroidales bacterium]|jgi:BASS family bile acid:Na+ symporter|nr:bile acid:sodium symporter family protein [Bacteroidales bacterium]
MLEQLKLLDTVDLRFSQDGLLVLNITIAFIMFGVALGIKFNHFVNVFRDPRSVIVGFLSQFLLLPAVTFIIVVAFRNIITPTIGLGMIMVASCPGGNISNFMSSLSKGNAALSVSLTAIATMVAVLLTPLNFAIYGGWFTRILQSSDASGLLRPLVIDPVEMFKAVLILLGIPLTLGMLFNWKFPVVTSRIMKVMQILSIFLFLGMVVVMFKNNYDFFLKHIKYIFIIVLIHNSLAFLTGYSFSTITRRSRFDRRAITIETGIQNSGLGLVLLFNPKIFPADMELGGMAIVTAWWGIWHIISGLTLAGILSYIPLKGGKS